MTFRISHNEQFTLLQCCVLIPTYNNATKLADVLDDVLCYTSQVLVVNDGSTDNTLDVIAGYPTIELLSYEQNVGKGLAMQRGFEFARSKGFRYAITIDSDGQHRAKDLPSFLDKIGEEPGSLIIGSRNMDQENVPGRSSFGHKFSNFWVWLDTGVRVSDSQSGFRLYPIEAMAGTTYLATKYEFEIEVIVKAVWRGINVVSVPITVFYPTKEERISHFRPWMDSVRATILNIYLFVLAVLIYRPLLFFKGLQKKNIRAIIREAIIKSDESNARKAIAVAFGIFMGIIPIWGFQIVTSIALAFIFRLNKVIVLLATNVSIFPPLIIYLSFVTGAFFFGDNAVEFEYDKAFNTDDLNAMMATHANYLYQYLAGSILLAVSAATVLGLVTYGFLAAFRK